MSAQRFAPDRLAEALPLLLEALAEEPVEFAFLHGSATEGRPFHDLDVAVFLDPAWPGLQTPLDALLAMGDRLERRVRLPVDLHFLNAAPVGFAYHVSRGQLLEARSPERLADWRERVWGEYLDMLPYLREQTRAYLSI